MKKYVKPKMVVENVEVSNNIASSLSNLGITTSVDNNENIINLVDFKEWN